MCLVTLISADLYLVGLEIFLRFLHRWLFFSLTCIRFSSYLFGGLGAALRAISRASVSSWASWCCLEVNIFGHVDIIVQQHLLLHPSGGAPGDGSGGLSVTRLTQLLLASPAAAPAVSLQARLYAATAAVGGQEGYKWKAERG